jgi:uncharacterized protein Veg
MWWPTGKRERERERERQKETVEVLVKEAITHAVEHAVRAGQQRDVIATSGRRRCSNKQGSIPSTYPKILGDKLSQQYFLEKNRIADGKMERSSGQVQETSMSTLCVQGLPWTVLLDFSPTDGSFVSPV